MAACSLFCTCTWAMSGLVPGAKVAVICAWPVELAGGGEIEQVVEAL